jgi:hypothetical protein
LPPGEVGCNGNMYLFDDFLHLPLYYYFFAAMESSHENTVNKISEINRESEIWEAFRREEIIKGSSCLCWRQTNRKKVFIFPKVVKVGFPGVGSQVYFYSCLFQSLFSQLSALRNCFLGESIKRPIKTSLWVTIYVESWHLHRHYTIHILKPLLKSTSLTVSFNKATHPKCQESGK